MKVQLWFILGLLVLASCNNSGSSDDSPDSNKYFEGYEGMELYWTDRDRPPSQLHYYSDTDDNAFDIVVEAWNEGASFARGGLHVSGYDPNLIEIEGIIPDIASGEGCVFTIDKIDFRGFRGSILCGRNRLSIGGFELKEKIRSLLGSNVQFEVKTISSGNWAWAVNFGSGEYAAGGVLDRSSRGKMLAAISMLAGMDFEDYFGNEYMLDGDTPEYPGGDVTLAEWKANVRDFPADEEEIDQTILVTNCYMYSTHASPVMCLDSSSSESLKKVCKPSATVSLGKGQGAPVSISRIEQENTPRTAIFTIHVENSGPGVVWDVGSLEKCNPHQPDIVTSADLNKIWLGQIRVVGSPVLLDCVPQNFIKLDTDTQTGYITCRYDFEQMGLNTAYQTPLVVELWYGYEDSISKQIRIKRAI
ncbi:hypothetical protein ACFL1B_04110 [Nanoarchaeota archaeon]